MIIRGNSFHLPLRDECVQMCVCSPPYWGLRRYSGLAENHYGLESTLDEYLANTVQIFREVRRVLKPNGTLWLNVGDAYAHNGACGGGSPVDIRKPEYGRKARASDHSRGRDEAKEAQSSSVMPNGLKPKDLIGLPWRVAFALQADGWWLRSAITLCKRNPMPESVTDRPTNASEMLFLLTKQADYYYDAEAVKERATHAGKTVSLGPKSLSKGQATGAGVKASGNGTKNAVTVAEGRNLRNWWEITSEANTWATCHDCGYTTERWPKCAFCDGRSLTRLKLDECPRCHGKQICPGCKGTNIIGHFAAFPTKLPKTCIKAGTSEKGECVKCGAQIERVTETVNGRGQSWHNHVNDAVRGQRGVACPDDYGRSTVAWKPTCICNAGTRSNLVCDPFLGSATTGVVAEQLGRRWVGVELSADYVNIAKARTKQRNLL